jgi:hypothetical protein
MRKKELIHIHSLFAALRQHLDTPVAEHAETDAFEEYDSLRVRSVELHKGKDEHQYAIQLLGTGLVNRLEDDDREVALPAQ